MTFYYFVNVTKNTDDIAGMTDIKNVGILSLFEAIIYANGWNSNDSIMAFPEMGDNPIMRYANGDFEFKFKCDDCGCVEGIVAPVNSEIDTEIDSDTEDENEPVLDNCTYCGDVLRNHAYGNICGKHIPSYALWDDGNVNDYDSNYSAFYEELCERKLAMELDEYDCGQGDIEDDRYSRSDIDQGYGYEDEGEAESCY